MRVMVMVRVMVRVRVRVRVRVKVRIGARVRARARVRVRQHEVLARVEAALCWHGAQPRDRAPVGEDHRARRLSVDELGLG